MTLGECLDQFPQTQRIILHWFISQQILGRWGKFSHRRGWSDAIAVVTCSGLQDWEQKVARSWGSFTVSTPQRRRQCSARPRDTLWDCAQQSRLCHSKFNRTCGDERQARPKHSDVYTRNSCLSTSALSLEKKITWDWRCYTQSSLVCQWF